MIDIYAPIEPYVGAGGFKLYSNISELSGALDSLGAVCEEVGDGWLRYTLKNDLLLFFKKLDGVLFKITTLPGYKGKLFGKIGTDTTEEEFLKLEPSFVYDDFEEVFESPKGIFIETDVLKHTASWISIFIKEITG